MLDIGDPIPDVTVTLPDGGPLQLSNRTGQAAVVYFYPRDATSGCTAEAQGFGERLDAFRAAGATVLGISRDTPASHAAFMAKFALTVPLASDETGETVAAFGVWVEKTNYGRRYMGIERATFLFGADGRLKRTWRKVRVPGHVDAVLAAVRDLG